jgi:hypothetical protein
MTIVVVMLDIKSDKPHTRGEENGQLRPKTLFLAKYWVIVDS